MRTRIVSCSVIFAGAVALVLSTQIALAGGPWCSSPYVEVQGAANPTVPDPDGQYTIQRVNIGEPFLNCTTKQLNLVLKMETMDPANTGAAHPPPNTIWSVKFTVPASAVTRTDGGTPDPVHVFFSYDTSVNPTGAFNYGWADPVSGFNCSQCGAFLCDVTGTVAPDGTITMNVPLSSDLRFGTCAQMGGYGVSVNSAAWVPGLVLSGVQGTVQVLVGGAGRGVAVGVTQTDGSGEYTTEGNLSCSNLPVAAIAATPSSGSAPLTVDFDASGSNIPAGGCGTINAYIFDFGDGQQTTQSTPTVSHTYITGGVTYPARVRVTTSAGLTSAFAQQNITVNTAGPPQLVSVVSRLTHGSAGDFDVVLPQPPATRGIECRSAGGNYKMIFNFLNNLTSVANASVTAGTGSITSSSIGPNPNQYTVNLTGVANQQNITVTLTGVQDSAGNNGPIISPQMGVLIGDVNASARVDAADVSSVRQQTLQTISTANFRNDINASGRIDAADVSIARQQTLTSLP